MSVIQRERYKEFFDASWYGATYRDAIAEGQDPLDHYLSQGARLGFLPSPDFDPVLYKIAYPADVSSDAEPLTSFLTQGRLRGREPKIHAQEFLPCPQPWSAKLPPVPLTWSQRLLKLLRLGHDKTAVPLTRDEHVVALLAPLRMTSAEARRFAEAGRVQCSHAGRTYTLIQPDCFQFLEHIRHGEPFALTRKAHGIWIYLRQLELTLELIQNRFPGANLSREERFSVALRLHWHCSRGWPNMQQMYFENFMRETLSDTPPPGATRFFRSAAFKGFPTRDNALGLPFSDRDILQAEIAQFARLFAPEETILDATFPKRAVISGAFRILPELCRDRLVILLGPPFFSDLGRRWKLNHYQHIRIGHMFAMQIRHQLLQQCKDVLSEHFRSTRGQQQATRTPFFMFCCGASVASWLIHRLYKEFNDVMYFDMGQALAAWYLDEKMITIGHWVPLYKINIIENMRLESFYKNTCGRHYAEWLKEH